MTQPVPPLQQLAIAILGTPTTLQAPVPTLSQRDSEVSIDRVRNACSRLDASLIFREEANLLRELWGMRR